MLDEVRQWKKINNWKGVIISNYIELGFQGTLLKSLLNEF